VADDPKDHLDQAVAMQEAAERAFDPGIAARYLALAAEWLRLADGQRRNDSMATTLDLEAVRQKLRSTLAALERDEGDLAKDGPHAQSRRHAV
jgi:hypothetical protein